MGREALNQELLDLGAPKYWHTEERRPATMSEIQDYGGHRFFVLQIQT